MENETLTVTAVRKRGRPVGADSEQTRRSILAAARDIIAERGYQAATFQQIAQRAGVSRPTLHYYFSTREDLYETLLADVRARMEQCAAVAVGSGCLRSQLAAFSAELHRLGSAEPALMKLVVTARIDHHRAAHRHEAASAVVSTVHAFYDAVVVDAVRRGELAPDTDAHAVADMLAAVFWGLGFYAGFLADGADTGRTSEIARQLLRTLDGGLLHEPVGVERRA
ncbi:AcrR family transcriptional regulator [Mycolicibacterium iranicum]|uniref:AcrR family transcriptional regulator n=1 Tax=Mycolicibacterium iranicum TaxID=912594 RepID=A0A839Q6P9_MYCIR|nr:TetR/AcrR family transcriptional regulator [Mycolicibacterium iranicum]MBB2990554.1 AcrR family transcriptional regulator [Mycolicibacterium iranicum]